MIATLTTSPWQRGVRLEAETPEETKLLEDFVAARGLISWSVMTGGNRPNAAEAIAVVSLPEPPR